MRINRSLYYFINVVLSFLDIVMIQLIKRDSIDWPIIAQSNDKSHRRQSAVLGVQIRLSLMNGYSELAHELTLLSVNQIR